LIIRLTQNLRRFSCRLNLSNAEFDFGFSPFASAGILSILFERGFPSFFENAVSFCMFYFIFLNKMVISKRMKIA